MTKCSRWITFTFNPCDLYFKDDYVSSFADIDYSIMMIKLYPFHKDVMEPLIMR